MTDEQLKDDKPDELEIVETDAAGKPVIAADAGKPDDDSDDGDTRLSGDDGDDEGKPDDGKPARKRETHQERRERWRKARERDQREMNFLRMEVQRLNGKVHELGRDTIKTQSETVDARLADALTEIETAERIMAAAIKAQNGEDAVKAQKLRDEARDRALILQQQRDHLKKQQEGQPGQSKPLPPFAGHARNFAKDKPWFTWNRSDSDSRTVLDIDAQVAKDGFDPNTDGYWKELDRRVRQALPHHFKANGGAAVDEDFFDEDDDDGKPQARKGPQLGSGRSAPSPRKHEVYISPERKQAMIDAGVWDDPVLRRKYAKAYAEWDRENQAARR